jgi:hypothetical protein
MYNRTRYILYRRTDELLLCLLVSLTPPPIHCSSRAHFVYSTWHEFIYNLKSWKIASRSCEKFQGMYLLNLIRISRDEESVVGGNMNVPGLEPEKSLEVAQSPSLWRDFSHINIRTYIAKERRDGDGLVMLNQIHLSGSAEVILCVSCLYTYLD